MADRVDCRVDDSTSPRYFWNFRLKSYQPTASRLGIVLASIQTELTKPTVRVHKDLLTRRSDFCKQALENSTMNTIDLRSHPYDHLDRYIHHLYTGNIRMNKWAPCFSCACLGFIPSRKCAGCARVNVQRGYELLINLLFFSKKLVDRTFCNALFSAFIAQHEEFGILPQARLVKLAYDRTELRSTLRRFLVDMFRHFGDSLGDDADVWPAKFLLDLSNAGLGQGQKCWPPDTSCCDYHTHKADDVCPSKKRKRGDDSENE